MSRPKRYLALVVYLVPVLGWLYALVFHRQDEFATYHAKQSMVLTTVAVGAPAVWAIVGWIVSWVPLAGPLIAASLFALVMLVCVFLVATWVIAVVYALQGKMKPIPVLGGWAERIRIGEIREE